jgi:hypothetical protein
LLLLLGDGWIIVKEKLSRDSFDRDYLICNKFLIQRKPLIVTTLGLRENDYNNQMITISGFHYIVSQCHPVVLLWSEVKPNKLNVIKINEKQKKRKLIR